MKVISVQQMKAAERSCENYNITGLRLMDNAGIVAARLIREKMNINKDKVVVLCGKGNNGGDGYVVARKLIEYGANVQVISLSSPATDDAASMRDKAIGVGIRPINFEIYPEMSENYIKDANIIVDAIFGTGFSGELEGIYSAVVNLVNKSAAKIISLDVPSGINGDSGEVRNAVKADMTIVFGAFKPCHILCPSNEFCGEIKIADIGIPNAVLSAIKSDIETVDMSEIAEKLPTRSANFHKGNAGTAVSLCGSVGFAGAAVIAAMAAVRSGAGIVKAIVPSEIYNIVASSMPEIVCLPVAASQNGRFRVSVIPKIKQDLLTASALLVGCGLGFEKELTEFISSVLENATCPVVLDADGINNLSENIDIIKQYGGAKVITPHPKEAARLLGVSVEEVQADRFLSVTKLARLTKSVTVLKGANTLIATPDGKVKVVTFGNPGMATAGTGDMLAGMILAFLSQSMSAVDAAVCGAAIHALAGDMAAKNGSMLSMTPTDMINELPTLFQKLYQEKQGI